MKTLVTGGLGFIGSHLLDRLVSLNHHVKVLNSLSSSVKEYTPPFLRNTTVTFIQGDCTTPSNVQEALKDVDLVFHLAANPEVRLDHNDPPTCF